MSLKERLEAVWANEHIASPNHLARWNERGVGYSFFGIYSLYWTKGTLCKPKAPKVSKGYSYLCKNYQIAWRWKSEHE